MEDACTETLAWPQDMEVRGPGGRGLEGVGGENITLAVRAVCVRTNYTGHTSIGGRGEETRGVG